jgi:hypothetical protein
LQPEDHGEDATDEGPRHARDEKLFGDDLVILAEDITRPEIAMMLMLAVVVVMSFGVYFNICGCHGFVSIGG